MRMTSVDTQGEVTLSLREAGQRIDGHLQKIYQGDVVPIRDRIVELLAHYAQQLPASDVDEWSEKDVVLITYGDSVLQEGERPLHTLKKFMDRYLRDTVNSIHILPYYPFSSDDGFSVIDYRVVNPELGDWSDIREIADEFKLMSDLVINHVSRESLWFANYVADIPPYNRYFIELDPDIDVSMVTRPRNTPLMARVNTHRGNRYVWATFSEDQIDLDFSNPDVLLEFIDILLLYVKHGTRYVRLDAITYLWKQLGTHCVHLPQTHEVVKLLRTVLDLVAPGVLLLTETNVPHEENIGYFGDGDEANMVYQFALPPLTLYTLNRGNAKVLSDWAAGLPSLPEHCTFFNFTASHDGIGVRAIEKLLSPQEVDDLIDSMHRFGGFVSMKANADGSATPYEINISMFDALQGTRRGADQWQVARHLCAQAIKLAFQGIPGIYIHNFTATPNDLRGVEITGRTRSINRRKWQLDELESLLQAPNTPTHEVFYGLRRLVQIRCNERCFHPNNPQRVIDAGRGVFALLRTDSKTGQRLLALHNVTSGIQPITLINDPELSDKVRWFDLIGQQDIADILPMHRLQPYQVMWLRELD